MNHTYENRNTHTAHNQSCNEQSLRDCGMLAFGIETEERPAKKKHTEIDLWRLSLSGVLKENFIEHVMRRRQNDFIAFFFRCCFDLSLCR